MPLFVKVTAVIAWLTSLSIVALVPVDVLDSLQGTSGSITGPLGILWSISYWYILCIHALLGPKDTTASALLTTIAVCVGQLKFYVGQWFLSPWDLLMLGSLPSLAGKEICMSCKFGYILLQLVLYQ